MGSTTTFAEFVKQRSSEKIFLLEIRPAEVIGNWSATDGKTNTYEISYLNETITLTDSTTRTLKKEIVRLTEDGVDLTEKSSINEVEATSGTWWHDTSNSKLYVHPTDSDDPNDYTMIGFFWLYIGSKGIYLNDKYYIPYLTENGIPSINQELQNIFWGTSAILVGTILLDTSDGFFDQISEKFIWTNKTVKVLLGGDSLPYSEYVTVATVIINNVDYTRQVFSLYIRSNSYDMFSKLPVNSFDTATYPNLDPFAIGKSIPVGYGEYNAAQAPEVTCVDTAYDTNQYQFKIVDTTHASIQEITQVYINYQDGVGWQTISHANESLAAATFTITSASFVVGTTKVKVAFKSYASGGSTIEGCPEVVEDLLTTFIGKTSANLNSTVFTQSKADSDGIINLWIDDRISAIEVIENICKSDPGFFYEDEEGLFCYKTWQPQATAGIATYKEFDFVDELPRITKDANQLYWKILVGYSKIYNGEKEILYVQDTDLVSKYKYEKEEELIHDTLLRNSAEALILLARLKIMLSAPSPILSGRMKIQFAETLLGDKFRLTMERAPFATAGGYSKRLFELTKKDITSDPSGIIIEARDLREYGTNIGFWTASDAPTWANSAEADKAISGYWTDANGFVDPDDVTTLNLSMWW